MLGDFTAMVVYTILAAGRAGPGDAERCRGPALSVLTEVSERKMFK